jgi:hypothetical protein
VSNKNGRVKRLIQDWGAGLSVVVLLSPGGVLFQNPCTNDYKANSKTDFSVIAVISLLGLA